MFTRKPFLFICIFVAVLVVASVVYAVEGFSLTFNPTATISPSKMMLTVSGTVTCPEGLSVSSIIVDAFQQRGNRQMSASAYASFPDSSRPACTNTPIPWTAVVGTGYGLWQPGPVTVMATGEICNLVPDPWGGYEMMCEYDSYDRFIIDARLHAGS